VSYNTYLGKWIMVAMARPDPDSAHTKLHLFESSDGLNWSGRQQLESDPGSSYYPTIVGLGADPTITDSQFYVYYDAVQAGAPMGDHDWSRRLIMLSEASPATGEPSPEKGSGARSSS
jgi:hypothetical protein